MTLTQRELELVGRIEASRSKRKRDAWIVLVTLLLLVFSNYFFGWGVSWATELFMLALGGSIAAVAHATFAVREEDKLIDLLQRYVNSDPEAIEQLARFQKLN